MTIKELRSIILQHNHLYYDLDQPTISDYEYDQLIKELKEIDPDADDFIDQNLGESFFGEKVKHNVLMGSLGKSHSAQEVDSKLKYPVVGTHKIDGLSLSLHYAYGHLVLAATRGDGEIGEVVTENAKQINGIPLYVDLFKDIEKIEVRGEAYVNSVFFYANRDRIAKEENQKKRFKNPRNYAAGSVRQKNPERTKSRNISFVAYKMIDEESPLEFYHEVLLVLKASGFETPDSLLCWGIDDIEKAINYFQNDRINVGYDTDGIVFVMDNFEEFDKMGWTTKTPKGATAYKYDTAKEQTVVLDMEWNVGRTGKVVPVAILDPVEIAGATVSRMTLNNCDYIEKNNVMIGDSILIERSNEIIPKLVSVVLRPNTRHVEYPTECPSCNSKLVRDSVYLVCKNDKCSGQIVSRVEHFLKQLDVKGVAEKTLNKIFDSGLALTLREFFLLDRFDLIKIGFGEKESENIVNAFSNIKVPPEKFLGSLGIEGASERSFTEIIAAFSLEDVLGHRISVDALSSLAGYGQTSAETILGSLKASQEFINAALEFVQIEQRVISGTSLAEKSFCITGTLSRKRKDVEEMIKNHSGTIKGIGKDLSFLVVGDDAGSKLEKAQKFGVTIISEDELYKMIQ